MTDTQWHQVAAVGDIDEEEPISVKVGEVEIGVYKHEDAYYAVEDVCPHAYALLTQGFIEGCQVECPLHEAIFDVTSGKLLSGPGGRDLQTYEVKVEGDQILLKA